MAARKPRSERAPRVFAMAGCSMPAYRKQPSSLSWVLLGIHPPTFVPVYPPMVRRPWVPSYPPQWSEPEWLLRVDPAAEQAYLSGEARASQTI